MQQAAGVTAVGSIAGRSRGEGEKVGEGEKGAESGSEMGEKSLAAS